MTSRSLVPLMVIVTEALPPQVIHLGIGIAGACRRECCGALAELGDAGDGALAIDGAIAGYQSGHV